MNINTNKIVNNEFDYKLAFSRNIGWLTQDEQASMASKTVAIAGMGGVGGQYAEVLARLGIGKFHIADFDEFEIQNFNRQNCSGIKSLHRKKVEVLREKILDINPLAEVTIFEHGLTKDNVETFLKGSDLYLDGLDFFVFDMRVLVFQTAHKLKIPALTVAPVGMGASLIIFTPDSMSFDDHFGIKPNESLESTAIKFMIGLTPTLKHLKYIVDRTRTNFQEKRAPSVPMGPYLCAGVAGTEVIKIFFKRPNLKCAPYVLHFDAYLQSYHKTYLWMGHKNIIQRFKFIVMKKFLDNKKKN